MKAHGDGTLLCLKPKEKECFTAGGGMTLNQHLLLRLFVLYLLCVFPVCLGYQGKYIMYTITLSP